MSITAHPITLPPVSDVLVLAKRLPQGKLGVMESFRFIAPDEFEMFDVVSAKEDTVEAVLINKRILKRLPAPDIIRILKHSVFPYVSRGEAVKVDLAIEMTWDGIDHESDD